MASERAKREDNRVPVALAVTNDADLEMKMLRVDPLTLRLLTSSVVSSSTLPTGAATEATLTKFIGLSGTGTDTTLTLTLATTAYQVPASVPTSAYSLIIYNASDTDIYFRFTTGTTGGTKIAASGGTLTIDLGANQNGFVYCSSAGKILNISYKEM